MAGADYRRRHSDLPRIVQRLGELENNDIRNVQDLRNSPAFMLRERSSKSFEVANVLMSANNIVNSSQSSCVSLCEEYIQVADVRCHKAIERHRLKREEDIISRHTTFFPKKLTEEETKYAKSCSPLNANPNCCYDMEKFPRGILSLINEDMFCKSLQRERRLGTNFDADELTSLFLNLGFIVQRYDNYSKKEMTMVLEKDARQDYTNLGGCCVCAILSYGGENEIYAIDKPVSINKIAKIFNNGNLDGIPKIFIMDACRGNDYLDPADKQEDTDSPNICEDDMSTEETLTLPPGDDFVYAYSTIAGFYSWRNNTRGSWFLQSICSVLKTYAHAMELTRMLTGVNKRVARKLERASKQMESGERRQTSSYISKLKDEFYLCPPYGPLPLKKIPLKWVGLE